MRTQYDVTRYRALAAAILLQAYKDFYAAPLAPNRVDVRRFLHSDWCQALCDSLDTDWDNYRLRVLGYKRATKRARIERGT